MENLARYHRDVVEMHAQQCNFGEWQCRKDFVADYRLIGIGSDH